MYYSYLEQMTAGVKPRTVEGFQSIKAHHKRQSYDEHYGIEPVKKTGTLALISYISPLYKYEERPFGADSVTHWLYMRKGGVTS